VLFRAVACLVAVAAAAETVVDGRAIADEQQGANWLSYGRTYAEHHYSPLTGINAGNVRQLGLAWFVDLPGQRSLETPPLAVDGVLYFSGTYGKTFAVEARTGRELWEFDPDLARNAPEKLRIVMGAHRGVAVLIDRTPYRRLPRGERLIARYGGPLRANNAGFTRSRISSPYSA